MTTIAQALSEISDALAVAHELSAAIRDRATPVTCELCGETRQLDPETATLADLLDYERWRGAHRCLAHWASAIAMHGREWLCGAGHLYTVPKRPTVAQIRAWRAWQLEHAEGCPKPFEAR